MICKVSCPIKLDFLTRSFSGFGARFRLTNLTPKCVIGIFLGLLFHIQKEKFDLNWRPYFVQLFSEKQKMCFPEPLSGG